MSRTRRPDRPEDDAPVSRARDLLRAQTDRPTLSPKTVSRLWKTTAAVVATAALGAAGLALGDPTALPQIAPRSEVDIRIGRNDKSGRIEIYGSVGSRASVRRVDGQVVIRLPGQSRPDLGDLRANPPVGIKSVDLKQDGRASELWLTVADHYDANFGRADGAVYVQIDPKSEDTAKSDNGKDGQPVTVNLQDALTPAAASASASAMAKVKAPLVAVEVSQSQGGRDIAFPFPGPTAAAVFRRGDAIWIVFDGEADLRIPPELKDGLTIQDVQWTRNDGFTAMRLSAPSVGSLSAINDGLVWKVRLGGQGLDNKAVQVPIVRDDSSGVATLNLNLPGAMRVAWISDPAVGDRMAVIPARGPVKNMATGRTMIDATLSSTAQGAAIVHMAPDVKVAIDGDLVEVSRPQGLTLSSMDPNATRDGKTDAYKNALYPALMNPDWSASPQEGFLPRYNALQVAAADEASIGAAAPTKARLALARFLVGQGLNYEAQGVLNLILKNSPKAQDDPQIRGLRVVSHMMTGRYADAVPDLSSPQLVNDPSAQLWSGYGEAQAGQYAEAVKDFKAGLKALDQFPPDWRTKLAQAYAYAALQQKDFATAQAMVAYGLAQAPNPIAQLGVYLVDAQLIEAQGDKARALKVYQAVAKSSDDSIATPAAMHAAMLTYQLGKADAAKTLASLDGLRFRWRGDDTELNLISSMGQIYLSEGRYRAALEVLRSGGQSFAGRPQALQINTTLNQTFRSLFLGGMADGLQPVEALGMFNEFQTLTPPGADGDAMVRKIVRRLVDVDLLDDAANLLDYQVNHRLDGVAKSDVAADLAAIYLMNREPQKALQALWSTRSTLLPKPVMAERRMLEARALTELNEPDKALDVLGNDNSPDADDVRADIFWNKQDYVHAAALLEKRLGDRYKSDLPLPLADESRVIRAGVAYSLLKDEKSLARLSGRYGKFADTASSPDALRVALAPLDGGTVNAADFVTAAANTDSFTGWVSGMKKRFRQKDDAAQKAAGVTPAPQQAAVTPPTGGAKKA